MKNFLFIFFLITNICFAQEPQNLVTTKEKLVQYHNSGEYLKDESMTVQQAIDYLKTRLQTASNKPLAIVLDIDETSLSNYDDMLKMDFGGTLKQIIEAEGKGTDSAIKPTLQLYNFAKANHIAVFFVTGRTENYRKATANNLSAVGYKNWDGLILKPEDYHQKSAAPFKIHAREEIEKKGFEIALNMGDQLSDLTGGHADKTYKMPNPYYIVP